MSDDQELNNELLQVYTEILALTILEDEFFQIDNLEELIQEKSHGICQEKNISLALHRLTADGHIRSTCAADFPKTSYLITASGELYLEKLRGDCYLFHLLTDELIPDDNNKYLILE